MEALNSLFGIFTISAVRVFYIHAKSFLTNGFDAYYPVAVRKRKLIFFVCSLAALGIQHCQSQIYSFTTPISGSMTYEISDLNGNNPNNLENGEGDSVGTTLNFISLTENVYLDLTNGTIRQVGSIAYAPSQSQNFVIEEIQQGIPAVFSVSLTGPNAISFDTGPVNISQDGNQWFAGNTGEVPLKLISQFGASYMLSTGGTNYSGSFSYRLMFNSEAPSTFSGLILTNYPSLISLNFFDGSGGFGGLQALPEIQADLVASNGFHMQLVVGSPLWGYQTYLDYLSGWGLSSDSPGLGFGPGILATNVAPNSPPIISLQATNVIAEVGESATLSVGAIGILPFTYQWFDDGEALPCGTNGSLSFTNLQLNQAGNYSVVVGNSFGSVTSSVVNISLVNFPAITSQPQDQVVQAYGTASFTVGAIGNGLLNYQWLFQGTNLTNSDSSILIITNVTPQNLGQYSVIVADSYNSVTSSVANLYLSPYLESPFPGLIAYWGQTNILGVETWGSGNLTYQWYFNGVAIPNATGSNYLLSGIQFTNAGLYSAVVSSPYGSVTNTSEQVVVNPANVSLALRADVVIQGTVGYNYIIQSTTNLADTNSWITETNVTLGQPVQDWDDNRVNVHNGIQKYYRVLPGQ